MAYGDPSPIGNLDWKNILQRMSSNNSAGIGSTTGSMGTYSGTGIGKKIAGLNTKKKKPFDWAGTTKAAESIVPYVSNIANSFRKAPNPSSPNLVSAVTLSNPNLEAQREEVRRQVGGLNKAFDTSLDSNSAAAAKISNNIQGLRSIGQSYAEEANAKSNVGNSQAQINANIAALNAGKLDQYNRDKTEMQIANMREGSENVSNAADKYIQGEYRTDMMNLDKDKFNIISQAYAGSGVTDRLVNRILGKPADYQATDEEKQKVVSGEFEKGGWMYKMYKNGGGLSRASDYGSAGHPYPSVNSSDFAGGGRSYPIPTEADGVDALRLARLHGREDVIAKVHAKYPDLKAGGGWLAGATNPEHEGYCSPMTKATCTGHRKAFAEMMKKNHGFHAMGGALDGGPGDKTKKYPDNTYKTQAAVDNANAFAKSFGARKGLVNAENMYVAKKPGDPIVPFTGATINNPLPYGTITNISQIPLSVKNLDLTTPLPSYVDDTTGDLKFTTQDIARSARFNPNRGQTADALAMKKHGGKLKKPFSKVNNNKQSIPPEMAGSYASYGLGGHLFSGMQLPKMRGRIRKVN